MNMVIEEEVKRWTAKRKAALVTEIIQGKTTLAEASQAFDMPPSEIKECGRGVRSCGHGVRSSNRTKMNF